MQYRCCQFPVNACFLNIFPVDVMMKVAFLFFFFLSALHPGFGLETRSTASLSIPDLEVEAGVVVDLPVTLSGFNNVIVFECWISFNPGVLEYVEITNLHPGIGNALSGSQEGSGIFALTWYGPAQSIPANTVIFNLRLHFCSDALSCALDGSQSAVEFISGQTYLLTNDYSSIPITYNHGSVSAVNPLYALFVEQTGPGDVLVNNQPYQQPLVFENNSTVSLQAIPAEGWQFDGWSGDQTGNQNPTSLLMDGHKTVMATFTEIPIETFVLTFDVANTYDEAVPGASITINGDTFDPGHYVFPEMVAGTYSYVVSHPCYQDVAGTIVIEDADVLEEVVLPGGPAGDANGDGQVNVLDVISMVSHYASIPPSLFCFHNADVNGDGSVDILDVILVINGFAERL